MIQIEQVTLVSLTIPASETKPVIYIIPAPDIRPLVGHLSKITPDGYLIMPTGMDDKRYTLLG